MTMGVEQSIVLLLPAENLLVRLQPILQVAALSIVPPLGCILFSSAVG